MKLIKGDRQGKVVFCGDGRTMDDGRVYEEKREEEGVSISDLGSW